MAYLGPKRKRKRDPLDACKGVQKCEYRVPELKLDGIEEDFKKLDDDNGSR